MIKSFCQRCSISLQWIILLGLLLPVVTHAQTPAIFQETRTSSANYALRIPAATSTDSLLSRYIQEALENSPALKAEFESWVSATSKKDQYSALPDPEIMFQYYVNPESFKGPFSQATIGVMQMFPWFGTRQEGRLYAGYLANARWQQLEKTKLEITMEVKDLWFRINGKQRSLSYLQEHLDWVVRLQNLTRSRLETGYASRADVIRLELESEVIKSDLRTLRTELNGLKHRFNILLSRDLEADITLPAGRPELTWNHSLSKTLEVTLFRSPEIRELDFRKDAAVSMERQARLMGYPMFGVGVEVMGSNYVMGSMGRIPVVAQFRMQVPIWRSKYQAAAKEAAAETRMVGYLKDDVRQNLTSEATALLSGYTEIDGRVKLYTDKLIPGSRELTDLLLVDYSGGRARLDEVIAARRSSVDYLLELENLVLERNRMVVQLEFLTAADVPTPTFE